MVTDRRISPHITDEAARWITDRDAGLLTPEDERAMAQWIAADPLHALAFQRAEKLWKALGTAPVKAEVRRLRAPSVLRSRRVLMGALAASLALVMIGIGQDWPTRLRADIVTGTGERRDVTLADGSVVRLNTDSAIAVAYRSDRRVVRLLKGEAGFRVAAEPGRPFTVEAGDGSATALGTRFIVRRDGDGASVTVTEHRVRVAAPLDIDGKFITIGEGEAVRYDSHGLAVPAAIDVPAASAWTRGKLVFIDRPLGEVVDELGRYHSGYIAVLGTKLAQRRVSGVFRTDDPVSALDTLQRSLGIASMRLTDRLILLHD